MFLQVLLCFSRDHEILKSLPNQTTFMQVPVKGKQSSTENTIAFPPSGVIPFHGFTMYCKCINRHNFYTLNCCKFPAAPICYLYESPVELYYIFRSFYFRYWHKLHRVCASTQSIVSLCLLFERLLQCYEPFLWNHFKKYRIPP